MANSSTTGGRPTLASLAISEAAACSRQMTLSLTTTTTTSVDFALKPPPKLLSEPSALFAPEIIEVVPGKPTPIIEVYIQNYFFCICA